MKKCKEERVSPTGLFRIQRGRTHYHSPDNEVRQVWHMGLWTTFCPIERKNSREVLMGFLNKTFEKNKVRKRSDLSFKKRARSITALVLALLLFLNLGRVGWIMGVHGDEYRSIAEKNQLYDTQIKAVRGTIYDCNMTPLVTSSSAWIFCADPAEIKKTFKNYPDADEITKKFIAYLSKNIAKILSVKTKEISEKLSDTEKTYIRLAKKVDANQRLSLDELLNKKYVFGYTDSGKERTITPRAFFSYENDTLRLYPENNFASTIIGVTDSDGKGISGVETYYNTVLSGKDGRQVTAKNSIGQALDSSYESVFDATEGNGVVLTINSNIQYYLENALNNALENTKAKGVYGIVMEVDTGKVLAMSNKPDFDLNNPREIVDADTKKALKKEEGKEDYASKLTEALFKQWNSYCVTNNYEPGSTFKIFTAAAALEEGVANLNTTYTCHGSYHVADTTIHCAKVEGHGFQTFTQGLMNSCNPFFIDLGQKLGVQTYYKYFEAFGFTERTGIDLTGESYPVYHKLEKMGVVELASTSYGQSFRVSPVQMITATCAIANGGKLMKPYVVDSIVDTQGNIISKNEPTVKRQVISEKTAATVREMMEAVVEGGTGKNAYIEGYRVAGKTATSEKLDTEDPNEITSLRSFALPLRTTRRLQFLSALTNRRESIAAAVFLPLRLQRKLWNPRSNISTLNRSTRKTNLSQSAEQHRALPAKALRTRVLRRRTTAFPFALSEAEQALFLRFPRRVSRSPKAALLLFIPKTIQKQKLLKFRRSSA